MFKIAHIVNPFSAAPDSQMHFAQQLTFESMRRAKNFSKHHLDVELLSAQFEEDVRAVPEYFIQLPHLKRSILDFVKSPAAKKFPLLCDIIEVGCHYTDADYIIYTNTDITIVPHFYEAIAGIISLGYDAISINRRRIPNRWKQMSELPLALAQMGKLHPGYDCFVFHRKIAEKFVFSRICIGTGFTSVAFIHNLIAFAENPFISDSLHLTVHLGLEVMPPLEESVYSFTKNDYRQNIYPKLKPFLHLHKFPYSSLSLPKRLLKWMLNPNFSSSVLLELEGQNLKRKIKALLDEVRFELMGKIK